MSAQIKMGFIAMLLAGLVTAGCSQEPKSANGHVVTIRLASAAFADGQPIPVLDTGSKIKGRRLDVFFTSHQRAKDWGCRWVTVTILDD